VQQVAGSEGTSALREVANYFAAILLFYFAFTFLTTEGVADASYRWQSFLLDSAEAFLILLAFLYLGFPGTAEPRLRRFYGCIALLQVVHLLWRYFHPEIPRPSLLILNLLVLLVFGLAALREHPRWLDPAAAFFLAVMVALYIWIVVKPKSAHNR
jgi:hypothetical protein